MKMTMTATGDSILVQGYQKGGYEGFKEIKDFIGRGQAKFGNLEICITENDTYCSAYCGGLWLSTKPPVLGQIADFGFDFMGFANNHTMDYGPDGLIETLENAQKYNLAIAGAGKTLSEAAAPVYRDFPGGRVAFIAVCSTFVDAARAGYSTHFLKGRPGLNPLRSVQHFTVNKEHFDALKEISKNTYMNGQKDHSRANGFDKVLPEGTIDFGGITVRLSENGKEEKINHPNPHDMKRIESSINDAKKIADYVVIMVHSHQIKRDLMCEADYFIEEFSRNCIDVGADAIIGSGTHEFKGIEIYNNKPIFYSIGNFCFQLNTVEHQPEDMREKFDLPDLSDIDTLAACYNNWENGLWVQRPCFRSVIPYLEFEDGNLTKLQLQPIELGFDKPKNLKGLPFIAKDNDAKEIYEILAYLSEEYGTKLELKNDIINIEL